MDVKYDVILGELRESDSGSSPSPTPSQTGKIPQETVTEVSSSSLTAEDNKVYKSTSASTIFITLPAVTDNTKTHSVMVDWKMSGGSSSSPMSQTIGVEGPSHAQVYWVEDPSEVPADSVWRIMATWSPLDSQWKVIPIRIG